MECCSALRLTAWQPQQPREVCCWRGLSVIAVFHAPGIPCPAGLVLQMEGQPFNTNGWGGVPASLSLCVEKDKQTFCLQGETHLSLVHSVPPFGKRHITHVCGSWEMLRPNIKDVMYQLEVNTFKDGLLAANDHAGCGAMLARCGAHRCCWGPWGIIWHWCFPNTSARWMTIAKGDVWVCGWAAECTSIKTELLASHTCGMLLHQLKCFGAAFLHAHCALARCTPGAF